MKHQPWVYALSVAVLCFLALPLALALAVFLLLVAAVALCLWPIFAGATYCATRDAQRDARRARYGGPVSTAEVKGPHPVETCPCEVCAARRDYLYGNREPQTQG